MIYGECKECGKKISAMYKSHLRKFCSHRCANTNSGPGRMKRVFFKCKNCGKSIEVVRSNAAWRGKVLCCSRDCWFRYRSNQKTVNVNCGFCGKVIRRLHSRVVRYKRMYCGRKCFKVGMRANPPRKAAGFWYENGYRVIHIGRGKGVKEHIKIMQEYLGRKLYKYEVVHHIDGDKLNNNLSNLKLMTRRKHAALHRALRKK